MPEHKVFCVKLHQELPGLDEPPFDTELGQKIYQNVSQQAWNQWTEFCKMLLNEYRLNPARREDQDVIVRQLRNNFFGKGLGPPRDLLHPKRKNNSGNQFPCRKNKPSRTPLHNLIRIPWRKRG